MAEPPPTTHRPAIEIVVAVAENRVIGRGGGLPWRLPEDLRHFKRLTVGQAVVMGRRTYESIGRPLPDRLNLVLSRSGRDRGPGVAVVGGLAEAEARAAEAGCARLFVIGGESVFAEALPRARALHLTLVHAEVEGDTFWPGPLPGEHAGWEAVDRQHHPADDRHAYPFTIVTLERPASG